MRAPNFSRVQAAFVAYVAGIFTCLLVMQCGKPAKVTDSKESGSTGEYYYIDLNSTLHAKRSCTKIATDDGAHLAERVPKKGKLNYDYICPKCVSDKEYNAIKAREQ